ncbi:MAG TPA: hypothetical protein VFI23_08635 [Rhizomicrobium sp.]|nr:hypothetical protein [Rhizomicrobium sp.]
MGLDISVGELARVARERPEDFEAFSENYKLLNEVLAEAGMPPHQEPLDIPDEQVFEAQMYGYSGLHLIRRLAAFHVYENRLPPPERNSSDPIIERLFEEQISASEDPKKHLRFQHLFWHSDCEGFYLPRDFERVVLDNADPQRPGLGGMIGSSPRLLQECLELAGLIGLPAGIDPEASELWEAAYDPRTEGELWQIYGVEAFGLARLIHACERSIKFQAALVFS